MTDRETEKCKKILEGLRRNPENRRCANCASMAVPYVCLEYGTFVCTRCSALHRDLTHRVKSITASKFKQEEIASVQGNGNDSNLYLQSWNESLYKLPGAGNEDTERAREFINIKYKELRWADPSLKPQVQQPVQTVQQHQPIQYQTHHEQPVQQMTAPKPFGAAPQPFGAPPAFGKAQPTAQFNAPKQLNANPIAQPQVQKVEDDPFGDFFGNDQQPAQVQQQQPPAQPIQQFNQPNTFQPAVTNQPTFNTQPQTGFTQNFNAGFQSQPTFNQPVHNQPATNKFNAGAFVTTTQTQQAVVKTDMNGLFGNMVNQAAKVQGGAKPATHTNVTVKAPLPKDKGGDLLDF
uniref:Arf GTP activating protein n=1 Tax=Trepomonas sp. PC1 TaxID=1076344 RepID=A0A146KIT5_9EUKA|eukprot:JAP95326.1 Arf GTP activating protein [Trepomonas sp. PC1]